MSYEAISTRVRAEIKNEEIKTEHSGW